MALRPQSYPNYKLFIALSDFVPDEVCSRLTMLPNELRDKLTEQENASSTQPR